MPDALDDLLFSERRTPAERAALRDASADPALREQLARWESVCAALRARLEAVLPDRRLLVLHALDELGEALTDDERRTLRAARADLERAFETYPALHDVVRGMQAECRAFDAIWTARAADAAPAPSIDAPGGTNGESPERRRARAPRPAVRRARPRALRWGMRTGVALALVAFAAVAVFVLQRDRGLVHVAADAPTTVALADGSTVRLLAGSRLAYPDPDVETAFRRHLHLEGAALFEIAPQPEPLVVETATARVTVLGTQFAVRADDDRTEVVLVDGRVQLASAAAPERPVTLAPGEASRVAAGALPATPAPVDLEAALDWTGLFVFRQTPAGRLADRLAAHYDVPVAIADALADERVTATFRRDQPADEVLAAVAATLGARLTTDGDGYRIE